MYIKNLPQKKKKELEKAYKLSKRSREQRRIQTIWLLAKGYSYEETSDIVGYSGSYINNLVTIYNNGGIIGLKSKTSPRNNSKLTVKQKNQIKKILEEYSKPSEAKIKVSEEEDYWSIKTLRNLVKKKYHFTYKADESYRKLFIYCNYSYQRVEFKDKRRNQSKANEFKKNIEMKIKGGRILMSW